MKNNSTILAILMLFFIISCNDDENTVTEDNTLTVMKTNLTDDLSEPIENISVGTSIEIIFSHSLDINKIESALSLSSSLGETDHTIEFSNTNSTVILTPTSPLEYETMYTISLPEGVYGAKGETLKTSLSINFSTGIYTLPVATLLSSTSTLEEKDEETATITIQLNKATNEEVTATLVFSGTATEGVDYTISGEKTISIPKGSSSTTVTITSIADNDSEGAELISIALTDITNAIDESIQLNIAVNDPPLALSLQGIMSLAWDSAGTNGGKAIHLVANEDIADLSLFGLGTANNGGGTDGKEYVLPAQSVSKGDDILLAREVDLISAYFEGCMSEFEHIITAESTINQNGDDAIELFQGDTVIETYGDANIDGTGEDWEYSGSWAYKVDGFWTTGGIDCSVGSTTNSTSACPYPLCAEPLMLQGILALSWEGSGANGGKAIHLKAVKDIPDLSIYGLGTANNGGGSDGLEYTLPNQAVNKGDDIIIAREPATLAAYFGTCIDSFDHVIEATSSINQSGDDAIELFKNGVVIETYGDVTYSSDAATPWEYTGSWAYKVDDLWTIGGIKCADGSTSTQSSSCVYPICN
ncbi:Ig-like domain-containing protein [Abyssalbus ytuae]|uniref:Ig-like domain-containing protein n=1 Tax=Abyssalbus ytuae TaxID=2926907 RepID=A0A9E6ZQ63_9FLAO|nr:Ig-like domain-containing protein [Abyssalbus ytuae]UOB18540.1 Ig-like domain-containing protein [Abyssalbus ytuae]